MKINIKKRSKNDVIQIHDHDLWNLDITLAKIIAPCLRKLKLDKTGIPGDVCIYEDDGHAVKMKESERAWNDVLDEMIYAFESIATQEHIANFDTKKHKRIQRGLNLFAKHYMSFWT